MSHATVVSTSEKDVLESIRNTRANIISAGLNTLNWPKEKVGRFVTIGLSGAGKSTFLEFLRMGSIQTKNRKPTLSFQFIRVDFGKVKAVFVDVPGQIAYMADWGRYLQGADGVILVVDSTDYKGLKPTSSVFHDLITQNTQDIPVVVLANKQDLKSSLSDDSISSLLQIDTYGRTVKSFGIAAINGMGVYNSLRWLMEESVKRLRR